MRVSEIQRRHHLPEDAQKVPVQRAVGWGLVAVGIAIGIYLFFRYAGTLPPLVR